MNKYARRFLSIFLGTCILFSSFSASSALESVHANGFTKNAIIKNNIESNLESSDIHNALNPYGFTFETISLEELPEDVTILKFNSKDELEKYFAEAEENFNDPSNTIYTDEINPKLINTRSTSTVRKTATKAYGLTQCNLIANISVYSSGSFRSILSCSQYTNITGTTLGMGWNQRYATNNLNGQERTNITISGEGDLITYILSESFKIEIARRTVPLSIYYSVY